MYSTEIKRTAYSFLASWTPDHTLSVLIGALVSVGTIVLLVCLMIRRLLASIRQLEATIKVQTESVSERPIAESEQLAELIRSVHTVREELVNLRTEHNSAVRTSPAEVRPQGDGQADHQGLAEKHKDLVTRYNDLVKKFNQLLQTTKVQQSQSSHQVGELRRLNEGLTAGQQELDRQLQDALREKWELAEKLVSLSQDAAGDAVAQGDFAAREASNRELELLKQLERLGQQLEAAERGKANLEAQLSQLGQQNEDLSRQNSDLRQRNEGIVREGEQLQQQVRQLERSKEEAGQQMAQLTDENLALAAYAAKRNQVVLALRQQKAGLALQNDELRQRSDSTLHEAAQLRQQVQHLERNKEALDQQVRQLAQENQIFADQATEQRQEVLGLRLQNAALSRHEDELRHRNQEVTREAEQLRKENQELQKQLRPALDFQSYRAALVATARSGEPEDARDGGRLSASRPDVKRSSPPWNESAAVTLGLDFGTHSTKAILRARGQPRPWVLFLDDPTAGYPSFASPSLVRLSEGRLFFGAAADRKADGLLFRSLKVSLLPPFGPAGLDVDKFPVGTTPDLLVACYLAWVLERVQEQLGKNRLTRLSLNMAAPMDHLENNALKERYLHVVHAAWELVFGEHQVPVGQGMELARLRPLLQLLLERAVPDLSQRRFEIQPETLAPLVSLSQDPQTRPGFYQIVDMGAGTTEFSISDVRGVSEKDGQRSIVCYADQTIPLGGDQFNRNDQTSGSNAKEEDRLRGEFLKAFRGVWYCGFKKDKDGSPAVRDPWKSLEVILSGGGLRRKTLEKAIEEDSPLSRIFLDQRTNYSVRWHIPSGLEFFGRPPGSPPGELEDSLAFLAVAHGLSVERQRWPTISFPRDVDCTAPESRPEDPFKFDYLQSPAD